MNAQEIIDRIIISEAQINGWRYSQGETGEEEDSRNFPSHRQFISLAFTHFR